MHISRYLIYTATQAEYVIRIIMAASQEYVNTYSIRRVIVEVVAAVAVVVVVVVVAVVPVVVVVVA